MNLVTVILKSSPHVLQFHYDKYVDAVKAKTKLAAEGVIEDDYGSQATVIIGEIAGVFLTDLYREMTAQELIEVEKHRKDISVGKKMQAEANSGIAMPRGLMGNN